MRRTPAPQPASTSGWLPMAGWRAEFTNISLIILIAALIIFCIETCIYVQIHIFHIYILNPDVWLNIHVLLCGWVTHQGLTGQVTHADEPFGYGDWGSHTTRFPLLNLHTVQGALLSLSVTVATAQGQPGSLDNGFCCVTIRIFTLYLSVCIVNLLI